MSPLPYPYFFWLAEGDLIYRQEEPAGVLDVWRDGEWHPTIVPIHHSDWEGLRQISPANARARISCEYEPPPPVSTSGRLADAIPKDAPVTPEHDQMTPAQAANNRIAARRYALMLDGEDPDDPTNW